MDTISRENNSMLPMGGIIVGIVALVIGGYAAISVAKVNRTLVAHEEKLAKIDDISAQVSSAAAASDKASKDITALQNSTQSAVNQIATDLGTIHETLKHLQEAPKPARVAGGKGAKGEPAAAGPGEYIVKSRDSGAKIARSLGVSLSELESVNPGVNWTKLHVGMKLKVPEKKAAAAAAPAAPAAE
jgi:LysM repeat protein